MNILLGNNMKEKSKKMRLKFIIHPKFQYISIAFNLIIIITISILYNLNSYLVLKEMKDIGKNVNLPPTHPYFNFISLQMDTYWSYFYIIFPLSILISIIVTIYFSHKVVGPIVRLETYFTEIDENKKVTYDLKFRKGDMFSELPGKINRGLRAISKKDED